MSTFKVTVERLEILPHPNADRLELAKVGEYRAVVGKGQFRTGDYALYIPEQAVLPVGLIEELGLTGRLAGGEKNRVKAVRLRGELSQGIVCRPQELHTVWECQADAPYEEESCAAYSAEIRLDYAEKLRITKWVPPVPVGMAGEMEPAPDLMPWCEIENIKRYPDIFQPGEQVIASEKVHGSCCLVTYVAETGRVFVSSKGVGAKSLALKESDTNLYWRAVRQYELVRFARGLAEQLGAARVGLFGEVFGAGVQDLHYGADAKRDEFIGYALFDVSVDRGDGRPEFLDAGMVAALGEAGSLPPGVPVLYYGPYSYEALAALAEGREEVSGGAVHLREGLVVRPFLEGRRPDGSRVIAKFVSEAYLTRSGGTEYE